MKRYTRILAWLTVLWLLPFWIAGLYMLAVESRGIWAFLGLLRFIHGVGETLLLMIIFPLVPLFVVFVLGHLAAVELFRASRFSLRRAWVLPFVVGLVVTCTLNLLAVWYVLYLRDPPSRLGASGYLSPVALTTSIWLCVWCLVPAILILIAVLARSRENVETRGFVVEGDIPSATAM